MSLWMALDDEVAQWRSLGRTLEIWWRDDDAVDVTPALERLLGLRHAVGVPLALAVVPSRATAALADRLAGEAALDVLQHGYAHVNHAPPDEKKMELGLHRPAMHVLGDLGTGWLALERLFQGRALPVLVPPWNRIALALVPALPEIGFRGLSTFGARPRPEPVRGLRQVNTHLDLIDWRGGRRFVGRQQAVDRLVAALAAARSRSGEPVGILSHHLAMDDEAWDFLVSLWEKLKAMPGVTLPTVRELFGSGETRR
jgi:hypothetical protein